MKMLNILFPQVENPQPVAFTVPSLGLCATSVLKHRPIFPSYLKLSIDKELNTVKLSFIYPSTKNKQKIERNEHVLYYFLLRFLEEFVP